MSTGPEQHRPVAPSQGGFPPSPVVTPSPQSFLSSLGAREIGEIISVIVMIVGVLLAGGINSAGVFDWILLLIWPFALVVMLLVRAGSKKDFRIAGLSLDQLMLATSVVVLVYLLNVFFVTLASLSAFGSYVTQLRPTLLPGIIIALIGALGFGFFAIVGPLIDPFRKELENRPATAAATLARIWRPASRESGAPRFNWAPQPYAESPAQPQAGQGVAGQAGNHQTDQGSAASPSGHPVSASPAAKATPAAPQQFASAPAPGYAQYSPPALDRVSSPDPAVHPDQSAQTPVAQGSLPPAQDQVQVPQAEQQRFEESAPSAQEAFWFAVPQPRIVVDPQTSRDLFMIPPGVWALALEERGGVFVVRSPEGVVGELRNIVGVERG